MQVTLEHKSKHLVSSLTPYSLHTRMPQGVNMLRQTLTVQFLIKLKASQSREAVLTLNM